MDKKLQDKIFNKYLEFFKHKEDLRNSLMAFGFEHGNGWYYLVNKLCHDIKKFYVTEYEGKDWDGNIYYHVVPPYFNVLQVKEKFGSLRFYVSGAHEKVFDMIHDAENRSFFICEECGNGGLGFYRDKLPWIRTLCDRCLDEHVKRRYGRIRKKDEDFISDWQKEHKAPYVEYES